MGILAAIARPLPPMEFSCLLRSKVLKLLCTTTWCRWPHYCTAEHTLEPISILYQVNWRFEGSSGERSEFNISLFSQNVPEAFFGTWSQCAAAAAGKVSESETGQKMLRAILC